MSRPIRVAANQPPERFYRGGARIRELRHGASAGGERVPEDWVASSTPLHGEDALGLTTLPDGTLLRDAQAADPVGWFGPDHAAVRGADPWLLVKLLDAGERLPVHAHPDDAYAAAHFASAHGKAEAWYVLRGGTIRLGLKREVSAEELAAWVAGQDTAAMLGAMHELRVEPGDGVFVPAGMLHAIGEGLLVVEVQQPSDLSILVEWKGYAIDGPALGHLGAGWDVALGGVSRAAADVSGLVVRGGLPDAADPFFAVQVLGGGAVRDAGFCVLVATEGSGSLRSPSDAWPALEVAQGDTLVIPFAAGPLAVDGDVSVVACSPPPTQRSLSEPSPRSSSEPPPRSLSERSESKRVERPSSARESKRPTPANDKEPRA